jgi:hypothetical protein
MLTEAESNELDGLIQRFTALATAIKADYRLATPAVLRQLRHTNRLIQKLNRVRKKESRGKPK